MVQLWHFLRFESLRITRGLLSVWWITTSKFWIIFPNMKLTNVKYCTLAAFLFTYLFIFIFWHWIFLQVGWSAARKASKETIHRQIRVLVEQFASCRLWQGDQERSLKTWILGWDRCGLATEHWTSFLPYLLQ